MVSIDAYLLQVVVFPAYSDTLLGVGRTLPYLITLFKSLLLPQKDRLKRIHSCVDEQKSWIVCRHHRYAVNNQVFFLPKKLQKVIPDFAGRFHRDRLNLMDQLKLQLWIS